MLLICLFFFFVDIWIDTQTLLSPVLLCGPSDLVLKKPAILSFQHCAALKQGHWNLSVYYSDSAPDSPTCWQVNRPIQTKSIFDLHAEKMESKRLFSLIIDDAETGDAGRGDHQHARLFSSGSSSVPLGHRPVGSLRIHRRIGRQRHGHQDPASCRFRSARQSELRVLSTLLRPRRHHRRPRCKFLFAFLLQ